MKEDRSGPPTDRRVGQSFGPYLIEEEIGRGGMGVVFRARHLQSGDLVALKLMAPDLAHNESFRERFVLEAEAGPTLGHPNIVKVFESGSEEGELFIAMELIEGIDLKGLIQREGRLDPKRALSIFRQAAGALDAAHESGMVHRDVKPQNILVVPRESPQGVDLVYLSDFGLVRPVTSETSASRTGQVFGSLAYMAPELIEGVPADGRADVYALGCVLFECLTGKVPFERENEISAVWAHIHEDPPLLTDTCKDLPAGLNDVVFRAMAKHPDDRFLTAGEFYKELELGMGRKVSNLKYAHMRPLVKRIPRRKTEREVWSPNFFPELARVRAASREPFDWRKGVALVAAVVALASVQVGREGGLPQAVADVTETVRSAEDTFFPSTTTDEDKDAGLAHKEKVEDGGGSSGEEGSGAQGGRPVSEPGEDDNQEESGSPQSGSVAKPEDSDAEAGRLIAFHRFNGCMHYSKCAEIYTVRSDGTELAHLTPGRLYGANPRWSPDGTQILFTGWDSNTQSSNLWITDVWVMNADGSGLKNLTNTLHVSEAAGSWSPDGEQIAFVKRSDDLGVWVMNANGTQQRQITSNQTGDFLPDWAPNGTKIVFQRGGECPGVGRCVNTSDPEVWVVDVRTGDLDRLGSGAAPQWAPDSKTIAFELDSGGANGADIYTMNVDGAGVKKLISSGRYEVSPSWRPDGRFLVFQFEGVLATLSVQSRRMRQISDLRTSDAPSWQPRSAGA